MKLQQFQTSTESIKQLGRLQYVAQPLSQIREWNCDQGPFLPCQFNYTPNKTSGDCNGELDKFQ